MIHFHCPACGTTLQLPSTMGGKQGPCPRCYQDIIAPNPTFGLGPRLAPQIIPLPPPPAPLEPERFRPFSDSPSVAPGVQRPPLAKTEPLVEEIPPAPPVATLPDAAPHVISCEGPRRAVLVLSCLLTTALGLGIGYLLGLKKAQPVELPQAGTLSSASQPIIKTVIPPAEKVEAIIHNVEEKAPPVEEPAPPAPIPVSDVPKKQEAAPTKISDQATAALKAFLDAPDWASRSAYVLYADQFHSLMEAYSHQGNDGPTAYTNIQVVRTDTDSATGEMTFIFQVDTREMPDGIPVAVQETPQGWLVDWPSFVEFRDDAFQKFAISKGDGKGTFHLVTRTPPKGEDQAKNEHFVTYIVTPPMPDRDRPVFCRKGSTVHEQLQRTTPEDRLSLLQLELTKKTSTDGKNTPYLEITDVKATNWRPSPP